MGRIKKYFFGGFCILCVLFLGYISFYTVEQGHRGLVLRFGKLVTVVEPGFHFKIPLFDTIKKMTVRTQKEKMKLGVYSKDVQGAEVVLSINFAFDPNKIGEIYTNVGLDYVQKLIFPQMQARPKDIFGKYNAVNIIQAREKLTKEIHDEMINQFKNTGIIIQSVQIENIDFSDSYENSVEERMKAEVEVQKVQQNLERERINADMIRTKAKAEADAKMIAAEAKAKAVMVVGKAEAEAIRLKAEAMKQNAKEYIHLMQTEKWDGKLPKTILPEFSLPVIEREE